MTKITARILTVLAVILLSGCGVVPLILTGVSAAGVAVNETTGKTLTDQTVSAVNGQDCRVSRMFKEQDVCREEIQPVTVKITTTTVTPSTVAEIEARYRR